MPWKLINVFGLIHSYHLFNRLFKNLFQDWLSCMRVGLCCENGQGYPVWFQSNAFSHFSHKLSIIFLPAFEKENCGSSFQYPSHREMGFWRGDVEGTAIRKGFYTSAISSVQNMISLSMFDESFITSRLRRCFRYRLVKSQWGGKRSMAPNSALCLLPSRCSGCSTWHHMSPIDDIFFFQGYFLAVAEICYWRLENSREESLIVAAFETPMRKALSSTIFSVWQKNCLGPIHSSWELAHFFWTIPLLK